MQENTRPQRVGNKDRHKGKPGMTRLYSVDKPPLLKYGLYTAYIRVIYGLSTGYLPYKPVVA